MGSAEGDLKKLGLNEGDWRAIVLGQGVVSPAKLSNACRVLAGLAGYSDRFATDQTYMSESLKRFGIQTIYLWLEGPVTHEEKLQILQLREGMTRDEAEAHLVKVQEDNQRLAELQNNSGAQPI